MKSAFELAMERLGEDICEYTDEQKTQLSELDSSYDAKIAQAKFEAGSRLSAAAGDAEKQKQIRDDLSVELASLNSRRDREKEALRGQFAEVNG